MITNNAMASISKTKGIVTSSSPNSSTPRVSSFKCIFSVEESSLDIQKISEILVNNGSTGGDYQIVYILTF